MAVTPDRVQIGTSSDYLDGVSVDTGAGGGLFRETVVAADPENGEGLARVLNSAPAGDDYGSVVRVAGEAQVRGSNEYSVANSTTDPLPTNGTFTGDFEDVSDYLSINVLVNTDRIKAQDGLLMQFSTNGVDVDLSRSVDITTGGDFVTFPCEAKFFRIVVQNGGGGQAFLRVQTHYSSLPRSLKGVPLLDRITDASTATLTRTVIEGKTTAGGGAYVPVKVNPSGTLATGNTSVGPTGSAVPIEATYLAVNDGSDILVPLVQPLTDDELRALPVDVDTGLIQPTTPADTQPISGTVALDEPTIDALTAGGGLTDAQLRASPVGVADDYQTGEILPDQTGTGGVLTFTFSAPVQNMWVYAVTPLDLTAAGEVRVDPFGGTPTASLGIPVAYGGITPIPTVATTLRIFAPTGARVTVYGNRR